MADSSDELQALYSVVGYVVVKWSYVEQALDSVTATIYHFCGGSGLRKDIPKFLMHKTAFIAEAVNKLPQLSTFKTQAEKVTGCVARIKDLREDFAHSTLTAPEHDDGVYHFARIDAKQRHHEVIDWDFDVRTLPKMAEHLESLAKEAQALSEALGKAFCGRQT